MNDDGKLSKEELLQCFLPKMSEEEAKQEVERIFNEVDKDQSGVIDYNGKYIDYERVCTGNDR